MYSRNSDQIGEAFPFDSISAHNPSIDTPIASSSDIDGIWLRLKARLRAELGEDVFNSWFPRMELVEVADGVVHLSVPTKFLKSWVNSHYRDRIRRLFVEQNCGVEDVELVVRVTGQRTMAARAAASIEMTEARQAATSSVERQAVGHPAQVQADSGGFVGSPLDRRLSFQSFLVGQSNAFAMRQHSRWRGPRPVTSRFTTRFTFILRWVWAKPISVRRWPSPWRIPAVASFT